MEKKNFGTKSFPTGRDYYFFFLLNEILLAGIRIRLVIVGGEERRYTKINLVHARIDFDKQEPSGRSASFVSLKFPGRWWLAVYLAVDFQFFLSFPSYLA